ncbi:PREDICTED: uncharacterized protein LOC104823397 [Tarenaya hassleriana]|uniref:uncharacterized protein LOC104823397 n=1 Tax=Tarenaya hassleriana TaxID=28532 RepID=UPI00053C9C31|nr:PREDICTED: uncharacterized protein LOC104823397 [Tarenaya hassleriana]
MEPTLLDDGEFCLPPEFLTDEDFLLEKENKVFKGIDNGDALGFRFGKDGGSKFSHPCDSRYGFGSLRLNSGLGSSVESLFGSTETESDEENYIAGLTRQMAHSTLEDDFSGRFCDQYKFRPHNNKGWSHSGSPESTLCNGEILCCCRQQSARTCQSRVTSQAAAAAWDLFCSAAEEMNRMKIDSELYGFDHGGRGLLGPPRKPSPVPVAAKYPNIGSGYYNHHSLPSQKLQAIQFQQLKQQQMMKRRHVMQNRERVNVNNNIRSVGLSPSAWPGRQHSQQPNDGSGMRAVFLGNPTRKRGSTGTGVFLPRHVIPASTETPKKQTLSTVLVPARVAQALNLNLDDSVAQAKVLPRFESQAACVNDASMRFRSNNGGVSGQKRGGMRMEQQTVISNELRLPSDWSY